MAKKFIDADILFKNIVDHHYLMVSSSNSTDYGMFTVGIKQAIDECPTADVEEVVRCKDCYYRDSCYIRHEEVITSDYGYCSRGMKASSKNDKG